MTPLEIQAIAISEAKRAGEVLGIPWSFIYGQWAFESTSNGYHFGSGLAQKNLNLAGIKRFLSDGTWQWRSYNSIRSFADDYIDLIQRGYPGVPGSQTIDDFSQALGSGRWGSWYGHQNYGTYAAGIKARISGLDVTESTPAPASKTKIPKSNSKISSYNKTWIDKLRSTLGLTTKPGEDSLEEIIEARKNYGVDTKELEAWQNREQPGGKKVLNDIKDSVSDKFKHVTGLVNKSLFVIVGLGFIILGLILTGKQPPDEV